MLRALRRIADADLPLPLQLGVNRGHVFAAEVGVDGRAAYSAMGDTTNTAARIMSTAPQGSIHAHPDVLEHSRTRFAVTPAGPFTMKGKAVPMSVYAVGEETGTREGVDEARLPFLGRDEEAATVRRALEDALGGAGGVITVDGATGMGKSRLAHEALDQAPDASARADVGSRRAVRGVEHLSDASRPAPDPPGRDPRRPDVMGRRPRGQPRRSAPDLVPMASLLADIVQVEVPADARSRPHRPAVPGRPHRGRRRRPDRAAGARPLVALVVEEAHWADGASVALLNRVAFATAGRPWAVLVVRRGEHGGFAPAVGGPGGARNRCRRTSIEHLVHAATEATPLRPHEVAAIVERAEGNPLFVEEVTRLAVGSGSLGRAARVGSRRHEHPDRPARAAGASGPAVLRGARPQLPAGGAPAHSRGGRPRPWTPPILTALPSFIEADDESRLQFRNSLVRDAAYEGLAFRVRARHPPAGRRGPRRRQHRPRRRLAHARPALRDEPATPRGRGGTPSWPGTSPRRSYANADAARPVRDAPSR